LRAKLPAELGLKEPLFSGSVSFMKATAPVFEVSDKPEHVGASVVQKLLTSWFVSCEDYRQRERRELIEREPSQSKLEQFRQSLKWLLRSGAHLTSLVTDPDYPVPHDADEIAWRVRQLEDSWKSLNNPMSAAEAQTLVKKHFPDEPLTTKLSQG